MKKKNQNRNYKIMKGKRERINHHCLVLEDCLKLCCCRDIRCLHVSLLLVLWRGRFYHDPVVFAGQKAPVRRCAGEWSGRLAQAVELVSEAATCWRELMAGHGGGAWKDYRSSSAAYNGAARACWFTMKSALTSPWSSAPATRLAVCTEFSVKATSELRPDFYNYGCIDSLN